MLVISADWANIILLYPRTVALVVGSTKVPNEYIVACMIHMSSLEQQTNYMREY